VALLGKDVKYAQMGGRHHPAVVAFCAQLPGEPVATGARRRDEDHMSGRRVPLADAGIEVTLAGAQSAKGHHLGAVLLRHGGHRDCVCVDVHADAEWVRLRQS